MLSNQKNLLFYKCQNRAFAGAGAGAGAKIREKVEAKLEPKLNNFGSATIPVVVGQHP